VSPNHFLSTVLSKPTLTMIFLRCAIASPALACVPGVVAMYSLSRLPFPNLLRHPILAL